MKKYIYIACVLIILTIAYVSYGIHLNKKQNMSNDELSSSLEKQRSEIEQKPKSEPMQDLEGRLTNPTGKVAAKTIVIKPPPSDEGLLKKVNDISDRQIRSIMSDCKNAIREKARRDYMTPFGIEMIHEYSADSLLWSSSSDATMSDKERISKFRMQPSSHSAMTFAVMVAKDSFSGPNKTVYEYYCSISLDLKVSGVTKI